MVNLPERTLRLTVAAGDRVGRTRGNPMRRGPVVLATDGSSRSGAAVAAARLLAARLDVPIEVISVLEPSPAYAAVPDVLIEADPVINESRRLARETAVRDYVSRFSGGAAPARIHVRFGNVATEVSRFVRGVAATAVVMGSAPHRSFNGMTSGDRAAQLLHLLECPVISVPPGFTSLPRVVTVAMDFSPASLRAAQAALLVVAAGGAVVLTHVVPSNAESEVTTELHALFERLRGELAPFVPAGVTVETRIASGDVVHGILSAAEDLDAGLVAVGTHGDGLMARLVGSITERVLHVAQQAVLASPPPPAPEAFASWRRATLISAFEASEVTVEA